MPITSVDLQGDSIVIIEDGRTRAQTVRREDTVISVVPSSEFKKITNIYIEPISGKLVVIHEA